MVIVVNMVPMLSMAGNTMTARVCPSAKYKAHNDSYVKYNPSIDISYYIINKWAAGLEHLKNPPA